MNTQPFERTRPMRVLALGMSRTGTKSMAAALSHLGYDRVYHGHDMGQNRREVFLWRDLWRRKLEGSSHAIQAQDFDKILGDCQALTDAPAALFWSELMDAYPDAQIVLIHRDTERWFQSFSSVCIDPFCSKRSRFVQLATRMGVIPYNVMAFLPPLFMDYFHARTEAEFRSRARTVYEEHYANITAKARRDGREILHMTLDGGFGSLCEFLGNDVPDVEFPRGNDGPSLRKMTFLGYSLLSGIAVLCLAGYFSVFVIIIWILYRFISR